MQVRVAAYAVIVRDGALLMSHWQEGDRWTLPGGGLEAGEDLADAAVREVFEETGYRVSLVRLLGISSRVIPAEVRIRGTGDLHTLQIIYEAEIVGGHLTSEVDGSSDEARWIPLDSLDSLPHVDHVDVGLQHWRSQG